MNLEYLLFQHISGRNLLFDLDNTIYDENIFLFRAYESVVSQVKNFDIRESALIFMKETLINEGREMLFDKLVGRYSDPSLSVSNCLAALRNFQCANCIETYSWFKSFIKETDCSFRLIIITNGNTQQQKNKILSINFPLDRDRIHVVYANDFEAKPSPSSYLQLLSKMKMTAPIYIGDSETDRFFCQAAGIEFFDVCDLL